MLTALRKELHYQYRCVRLARNLLLKRMLHCNLQVTYRCNFRCQICDFWKPEYQTAHELSLDDIRVIGAKLNRLGTLIISLAGGEPLIRLCRQMGVTYMVNLYSWNRGTKTPRLPTALVSEHLLAL